VKYFDGRWCSPKRGERGLVPLPGKSKRLPFPVWGKKVTIWSLWNPKGRCYIQSKEGKEFLGPFIGSNHPD